MPADGLIEAHLLSAIDCIALYCLDDIIDKGNNGGVVC
jgi:hypothetical protein